MSVTAKLIIVANYRSHQIIICIIIFAIIFIVMKTFVILVHIK